MLTLTDQLGRTITLAGPPQRIISTVPSQTELLYYLGADRTLAGITKFCTHPANKVNNKVKIGGTKQLNIGMIKALQPDLIIANKEENHRGQLEALMDIYPTYISNPVDLTGALDMIRDIGLLVGARERANKPSSAIQQKFTGIDNVRRPGLRVAYLIWRKPYMVAGKNTFIDDMLTRCGFLNAFDIDRYPEVDAQMLISAKPDVILLSSEPYPFKQKHLHEFQQLLPDAVIKLADGEMFSWYGSRLLQAPGYFIDLINSLKGG